MSSGRLFLLLGKTLSRLQLLRQYPRFLQLFDRDRNTGRADRVGTDLIGIVYEGDAVRCKDIIAGGGNGVLEEVFHIFFRQAFCDVTVEDGGEDVVEVRQEEVVQRHHGMNFLWGQSPRVKTV